MYSNTILVKMQIEMLPLINNSSLFVYPSPYKRHAPLKAGAHYAKKNSGNLCCYLFLHDFDDEFDGMTERQRFLEEWVEAEDMRDVRSCFKKSIKLTLNKLVFVLEICFMGDIHNFFQQVFQESSYVEQILFDQSVNNKGKYSGRRDERPQ